MLVSLYKECTILVYITYQMGLAVGTAPWISLMQEFGVELVQDKWILFENTVLRSYVVISKQWPAKQIIKTSGEISTVSLR